MLKPDREEINTIEDIIKIMKDMNIKIERNEQLEWNRKNEDD